MKNQSAAKKKRFKDLQKNMKALRQANITPLQLMNMMKAPDIWWKIILNFKEIEGSWGRALKKYVMLFEGVPRKKDSDTEEK